MQIFFYKNAKKNVNECKLKKNIGLSTLACGTPMLIPETDMNGFLLALVVFCFANVI